MEAGTVATVRLIRMSETVEPADDAVTESPPRDIDSNDYIMEKEDPRPLRQRVRVLFISLK